MMVGGRTPREEGKMQNHLSLRARRSLFSRPPPPGRRQCNSPKCKATAAHQAHCTCNCWILISRTLSSFLSSTNSWSLNTSSSSNRWGIDDDMSLFFYIVMMMRWWWWPIEDDDADDHHNDNDKCADDGDLHSIERCAWASVTSLIPTTASPASQNLMIIIMLMMVMMMMMFTMTMMVMMMKMMMMMMNADPWELVDHPGSSQLLLLDPRPRLPEWPSLSRCIDADDDIWWWWWCQELVQ